jgi:hypothetical protein
LSIVHTCPLFSFSCPLFSFSFFVLLDRLIHTCRLNRVNAFAYFLAITTRATDVKARPSAWLPWNYPQQSKNPAELDHDPPGLPA